MSEHSERSGESGAHSRYPAIAAALADAGIRGPVGLEAVASGDSVVALERSPGAVTV